MLATVARAEEPIKITVSDDRKTLTLLVDKAEIPDRVEMKNGDKYATIDGVWKLDKMRSTFTPRYPFERAMTIRVTVGAKSLEIVTEPEPTVAINIVTNIYPIGRTIPANQLRFYIEFAEPMRPGYAWEHISLHDRKGNKLDSPFLELDEELWSSDRKRFTLLLDPGRVKRELKPRLEDGPALEADREYTLQIARGWKDAEGRPLNASFSKSFRTGPAIATAIDLTKWKLTSPATGEETVEVVFDRTLDRALCQRVFSIVDEKGRTVECEQTSGPDERSRRFSLKGGWAPGRYRIEVRNILEDGCGNRIGRAFEVDLVQPIPTKVVETSGRIAFEVK